MAELNLIFEAGHRVFVDAAATLAVPHASLINRDNIVAFSSETFCEKRKFACVVPVSVNELDYALPEALCWVKVALKVDHIR